MAFLHRHPICIASPLRRSGTTLLQRLLTSSPDTLIYGENCATDLHMLTSMLASKEMIFLQGKNWRDEQLHSVLNGNVNDWIPDLMPDVDGYVAAYKKMIFSLMGHYASFAEKNNREIWGMKMPEWNPASLRQIQRLFPDTKIIYIHRNLMDVAKSAKKSEMYFGLNDLHQFCQTYKHHLEFARQHLKGENVLHLEYDALVENPEKWISEIELFTGAKNIDRKVMEVKVNTFDNDPKLEMGAAPYLPPANLTKEEMDLISSYTEAANATQTI